VLKLIRTNKNGIPDLLALKPDDVLFIEVKGAKGVVSPLQKYRIEELIKNGFKAEIRYEKA
jgi:Holliday junction resolvase